MTFKIGDRVIAYDRYSKLKGKIAGFKDDVIGIEHEVDGESAISFFHPKQCRKLKPKKRREWWINIDETNWLQMPDGEFVRTTPPPNKKGWIRLREVKE